MQHVRTEFPGVAFTTDNEITGLTLAGVGAGTTLDHIQVSYSGDDSYEWFGGTVNAKYLVAFRGGMPLGSLVSGYFASITSAPKVLVANGLCLTAVSIYFLAKNKEIRAPE